MPKKRDDSPRYRKLFPMFWRDMRVRKLSAEEKLLAAYCLTSHQTNRIGLFRFSVAAAAEDLDVPAATLTKRFRNVCETLSWQFDDDARCLYIPTWWRWNHPENPNNMVGNLRDLLEIPESFLLIEFANNTKHLKDNVRETFTQTLSKRLPQMSATFGDSGSRKAGKQEQDKPTNVGSAETPLASAAVAEPPLMIFDCDGEQRTWGLTQSIVDSLQAAFPSIDVIGECRKARSWVDCNPTKRKTANGMRKFLFGWIGKAQERGGSGGRGQFAAVASRPTLPELTEADFQ